MQIAIIGAGVNGLSCGIRLAEEGHAVTIFAERRTPDTTSDRSAAVFTPFRIAAEERVRRWTRTAYEAFSSLASQNAESGVSLAPMKEFLFAPQREDPWWQDLVNGFARIRDLPPGYKDGFAMQMPRMDMTRYMPWLERRFAEGLGGSFIDTKVLDLQEPFDEGFELVVNCSGLGARRLAKDDAVFPMRGQVLHVANTLKLDECLADEGRGNAATYIIPFADHVVLGGTFEKDEWIEETDEVELLGVIERCRDMLRRCGFKEPERLARHRIRVLAGLRPGRVVGDQDDCVRLERETLGGDRVVIHNYGHGRVGVTLSWGCAADVVALAAMAPA